MVSSRHRAARPNTTRRVSNTTHREGSKLQSDNYSHIQILPTAGEDNKGEAADNDFEVFIRRDSIQARIEKGLACREDLEPSPSHAPPIANRPLTFAEAAMSTQAPAREDGRQDSGDVTGSNATLTGPVSLESLGPFKYTFKKRKKISKWAPLDITGAENTSEVGKNDSVSDFGSSRGASPNAQTHNFDLAQTHNLTPSDITGGSNRGRSKSSLWETEIDTDKTPTQARFDASQALGRQGVNLTILRTENEPDISDSQSTMDRTEAAMGQLSRVFGAKQSRSAGEDTFDSLDWDPDLPSASPDESPKPITATPQPITYTTVGSLVNPNAVPQFSAPNRIQREGSVRRPLTTLVQNRQYDSRFQPRGPPTSLNMQNSMLYTQQFTQSPSHHSQPRIPPSSRPANPIFSATPLNAADREKEVSTKARAAASQTLPGGSFGSPNTPAPVHKSPSLTRDSESQLFGFKELTEEEALGRSDNSDGLIHGLEKLQILQRLSTFDNPMQELSRNLLSEFSVGKSHATGYAGDNTGGTTSFEAVSSLQQGKDRTAALNVDAQLNSGDLNHNYQFPTPSLASSSSMQANSLSGVCAVTAEHTSKDGYASRPPVYPKPLTAGPPGLRQHVTGSNKLSASPFENFMATENRAFVTSQYGSISASPWSNPQPLNAGNAPTTYGATMNQIETSNATKIVDTLPISAVLGYYPHGIPGDITGKYNPLPFDVQRRMDQVSTEDRTLSQAEKKEEAAKKLNNWFYDGRNRYFLSAEDHVREIEERKAVHNFGPIGPPSKTGFRTMEKQAPAADDIKKMVTGEDVSPLLNATFGTLLAYSDMSSGSPSTLSKFGSSPAWAIDNSEKGNSSFFSEDGGRPPKMPGKGPRYQPPATNSSKS